MSPRAGERSARRNLTAGVYGSRSARCVPVARALGERTPLLLGSVAGEGLDADNHAIWSIEYVLGCEVEGSSVAATSRATVVAYWPRGRDEEHDRRRHPLPLVPLADARRASGSGTFRRRTPRSPRPPSSSPLGAGTPRCLASDGRDVGGHFLDLLLAQRVREGWHSALPVRHTVDDELARGHGLVEIRPDRAGRPGVGERMAADTARALEHHLADRIALAVGRPGRLGVGRRRLGLGLGRLGLVVSVSVVSVSVVSVSVVSVSVGVVSVVGAASDSCSSPSSASASTAPICAAKRTMHTATKTPRRFAGKSGLARGTTSAAISAKTMKTQATASRPIS